MLMSREPGYTSWRRFKNRHASCGAKRICSCAFYVGGVLIYPGRAFSGQRGLTDLPPNLLEPVELECRQPRDAVWRPNAVPALWPRAGKEGACSLGGCSVPSSVEPSHACAVFLGYS